MGRAARANPCAAEGKSRSAANQARLQRFLTERVTTPDELESFVRAIADPSERQAVYDLLRPMCQLGPNPPLEPPALPPGVHYYASTCECARCADEYQARKVSGANV